MKLDDSIFAFTSWLMRNTHVETETGLTKFDGYDWYNYMWNKWVNNSDMGRKTIQEELDKLYEPPPNHPEKETEFQRIYRMGRNSLILELLDKIKVQEGNKMKQQTAVEWLYFEINKRGPKENNPLQWLIELYEQAKEMEKDQSIKFALYYTFGEHKVSEDLKINIEKLYNETYGGNK
jgi:hypothetical protein